MILIMVRPLSTLLPLSFPFLPLRSGFGPGFLFIDHRPKELTPSASAPSFSQVQAKVKALVKDKIIVGHAVFNDLAVSPESEAEADRPRTSDPGVEAKRPWPRPVESSAIPRERECSN